MKYCSHCGAKVVRAIPAGDDRLRHVCPDCKTIHYSNPKLVVGTLPVSGDKVLLCKRAIEPRRGFWTVPAGFMENGESTAEGAMRETWEEAEAQVNALELYRLFDIPHINQVYVFYRCELAGPFGIGPESLDSGLFGEQDIPWDDIAFPVVRDVLKEYFNDRRAGHFPVRVSAVEPELNR